MFILVLENEISLFTRFSIISYERIESFVFLRILICTLQVYVKVKLNQYKSSFYQVRCYINVLSHINKCRNTFRKRKIY